MKRRRSRAQRDHSTPRPPTTSAWVGEPITWGGQEAHGAGPSSTCVVPHGFSLQAFVCFPMVPAALSAPWVSLVLN